MAIIEGIGDEIIHIAIGIGVIILGMLAWWSTHIRDVALYRTIVIVERNRRNNNNNNNVIDNNHQTEPLGGIPVSRSVHTTLRTFNETESEVDNAPNEEEEVSPLSELDNQEEEEEGGPTPPQPSLQSERPLLVGDYVNPSLQNPPTPDTPDQETDTPASVGEGGSSDDSDIRIRLKYLNDEERVVDGKLNELLGDFKQRHFRSELSSNKVVRLIYNGHILAQDRSTLGACGVFNNCVIHCLVHPMRNQSHPSTTEGTRRQTGHAHHHNHHEAAANGRDGSTINDRGDEWGDLGGIFYILISIILCSAWYWRFQHSHLFSFTATAALSSITAIFSIFVFSITFFHNDEIPIEIM
uniref:Transmembrane and ubiquitin-like domain-containing protein 2 n=2 Tax=Cacopsylla melanoneura TaxID=428564 RepID=A0A8D8VG16_9HEMI